MYSYFIFELRAGADGACGLLFCAAKRSGFFPLSTPAGLRARASRLGGFTRLLSGLFFLKLGPQLFVIKGEAVTSRSCSSLILMGWWFAEFNGESPPKTRRTSPGLNDGPFLCATLFSDPFIYLA